MKFEVKNNEIVIFDKSQFNVEHILECGQIFTYDKTENGYVVFSQNKKAVLVEKEDCVLIETTSPNYFVNFFDLETDYNAIKQSILKQNAHLYPMIEFGSGIRILRQDTLEIVIGFIISANNNIARIKNSMKYIRENAGQKVEDYFAFPTLDVLSGLDAEFFTKAGLGYRASQIVKAITQLKSVSFDSLAKQDTQTLRQSLLKINGIGTKVADCILLFGFYRQDVFPVDTWIEKIFVDMFGNTAKTREEMRQKLTSEFGSFSGYVQQYLFYYKRTTKSAILPKI